MVESGSISFHTHEVSFTLENKSKIEIWIEDCISKELKTTGDISYIFCSDDYLHKINLKYLNHDTFTDIITFNYCEKNLISGDIFISVDRVKENAISFNTTFQNELHRVMIHGVLHLIGFDDKDEEDQLTMRAKEDFYLSLLSI